MVSDETCMPETHIYIEGRDGGPIHVCRQVYVNGTPVLLTEDGIEIEYGTKEPTVVTLRILPKSITFGPG